MNKVFKSFLLGLFLIFFLFGCASTGAKSASDSSSAKEQIVIKPKDATIHSERKTKSLKIESENGNLGYWDYADEYPTWDIEIPKAGKYKVSIRYAAWSTHAGSNFTIEIGDQKIDSVLVQTSPADDGYFAWKTVEIGTMSVKAGPQVLTMKITKIVDIAACNLLKIFLEPVN